LKLDTDPSLDISRKSGEFAVDNTENKLFRVE